MHQTTIYENMQIHSNESMVTISLVPNQKPSKMAKKTKTTLMEIIAIYKITIRKARLIMK